MSNQNRTQNQAKALALNYLLTQFPGKGGGVETCFQNQGDWLVTIRLTYNGQPWIQKSVRVPVDATDNNIRIV